eukprot:gene27379-33731_t
MESLTENKHEELNKFRQFLKEGGRERAGARTGSLGVDGETVNPLFNAERTRRSICGDIPPDKPEKLEAITQEYVNDQGAGVK